MTKKQNNFIFLYNLYKKSSFPDKIAIISGTLCGAGCFPKAPGTIGTIVFLPVVLLFSTISLFYSVIFFVCLCLLGVWAAARCAELVNEKDPKFVVIDEGAGIFLTFLGIQSPNFYELIIGFILFRIFDILKPPPVSNAEKLPGGIGIVADDLAAGLYSCAGLFIVRLIMN